MFSSGVELGKFIGSIDVIPDAYQAISEMTLPYELHTSRSGHNILAFKCSSEYTTRFLKGEFDLIPSEKLQVIDFILTEVNSSLSINEAAVELFQHLNDDLKEVENKHINTSLIITGSGLGGYLAILFTLRLHHAVDVEESNGSNKTKRPICITFGSPIIGDAALQRAIAERPRWNFSFLNVVAKEDPVASFFSPNTPYASLGTYLFCTESGGYTAFEDQDSILVVLDVMKLWNAGNYQFYDYTDVLSSIRRKVLYRGISESNELNVNSLRAGITFQLKEAGVLNDITNDDIGEMELKQINMIKRKNLVNASYRDTKKLNDMKISLTYMEWNMRSSKTKRGYYDQYKRIVKEKDQMEQKEDAKLRNRWLYSATNYRRITEPLDIAELYKRGRKLYRV